MSFQFVGFLLTYLLHTTHAAKNGSKAGLGIALVQIGFSMKGSRVDNIGLGEGGQPQYRPPSDPNSHIVGSIAENQDPAKGPDSSSHADSSLASADWFAYALMIVGWFILIKSVSNYIKARRHEQLVLQSPDRGLGIPVVAEGERAETVV